MPPISIATPAEIEGALDDSEILVLHLEGPHKGLILANKKSDATVAAAIAAGEVIQVETPSPATTGGGSTIPALPPVDSTIALDVVGANNYRLMLDAGDPVIDFSDKVWHTVRITHATGKDDAFWQDKLGYGVDAELKSPGATAVKHQGGANEPVKVSEILPLIQSGAVVWLRLDADDYVYLSVTQPAPVAP